MLGIHCRIQSTLVLHEFSSHFLEVSAIPVLEIYLIDLGMVRSLHFVSMLLHHFHKLPDFFLYFISRDWLHTGTCRLGPFIPKELDV